MGCWNKTCGLSNLHILAGSRVYVFILEQNTVANDRCYTTAMFSPVLLPFTATYDDYGGGEDCGGFVDLVVAGIRDNLIEVEQGDNEYHDIAVMREGFDAEYMFRAILESRLQTRHYSGKPTLVDAVMFRADVVDDLLSTYVIKQYVGDDTGEEDAVDGYLSYKFADVIKDIPKFVQHLVDKTSSAGSSNHIIQDYGGVNKVHRLLQHVDIDSYRYSRLVGFTDLVVDALKEGRTKYIEELFGQYLIGVFLDVFMDKTRKMWLPGGHEGSQNQDQDAYWALIGTTSRVLAHEKEEFDSW